MISETHRPPSHLVNLGFIQDSRRKRAAILPSRHGLTAKLRCTLVVLMSLLLPAAWHSLQAQQLITNGGFESGYAGWNTGGNFYIGALPNPHSGSYYAYLSNPDGSWGNNLYGTLSQSFTVPSNISNATLSFWISVGTNEPTSTGHDFLTADLGPSNTLLVNLSNANAGGYQQYSFNITSFAGQTVTLQFIGTTNSTYPTTFRIDDVSATYTPLPSPPIAPSNLQVVGVTGAILMQWQNNATNAANIEIQRASLGGAFGPLATIGASSTAYRDTVAIGNIMCYEVRATNNAGVSPWAGPLCGASIGPPTLSYPPDGVTLSNVTVNLSWQSALAANQYGVDVGRTCGGTEILNNQSTGGQVSYNLPVSPGTYVWRVRSANTNYPGVSDPSACSTFTIANAPPPVPTANFSWTPQTGIVGQSIAFTDTSTGSPTSWLWTFDDGGSSTAQNPSHTFSVAGQHSVTLKATNSSGSNSTTKSVTVAGPPAASFTFAPNPAVVSQSVAFTDTSTGAPTNWSWNFGDGATSTSQNPTHAFATVNTFHVTLTVSNAAGSNTAAQDVRVTAAAVAPVAHFAFSPAAPTAGQQVSFTDTSTGSPTSWSWTFNDGGSSTQQNPTHTFATAGTFHVSLTVSNTAGTNTTAQDVTVGTAPVSPSAQFTYSPKSPTAGQPVSFTDTSTGAPTAWSWNFGDNQTASTQNPTHTYGSSGKYHVILSVSNSIGTSTTALDVTVAAAVIAPVADFTFQPASPTTTTPVTFTDASSGGPTSWTWDFNDGNSATGSSVTHKFTSPGSYAVKLTATNSAGTSQKTHSVTVTQGGTTPPNAEFSWTPQYPATASTVTFNDLSQNTPTSWQWTFGDNTPAVSIQNPSHAFTAAGTYTVTLTATNGGGQSVRSHSLTVGDPPSNVVFSVDKPSPLVGDTIRFTASSTGGTVDTWTWNFGDGTTASGQVTTHSFATANTYGVSVVAQNKFGTAAASARIVVSTGSAPHADFSYTPANPTVQDNIKFVDTSVGNPSRWSWSIDGNPAGSSSSISFQFAASGNHTVSLDVYNPYGHANATRTIYVGNAKYAVGARVAAKVDFPGNNLSIRRGDTGTLVCTAALPQYEAFVNWDKPVDNGFAGFDVCANTAYPHHGWGVAMTQLEQSSTPAPPSPICSPGELATRGCTFSADCAGIQMRTCNLAGDGWSGWSECSLGSSCTTPLPSVMTTKESLFGLQQLTREEVDTPDGPVSFVTWVPITYKYSAAVTAVISSHHDSATQSDQTIIRRIDQSISVTPQTGAYGDPCQAGADISVDVYDGSKYVATIKVDKPGSYLVPAGTTIIGGYTDISITATQPILAIHLVASPQRLSDCMGSWAYSWQKPLN